MDKGEDGRCVSCGRILEKDEIALTKKMVNRGAEAFYCLTCLAARFCVDEDALRRKIREFREMGCVLFRQTDERDASSGSGADK